MVGDFKDSHGRRVSDPCWIADSMFSAPFLNHGTPEHLQAIFMMPSRASAELELL